MKYGVDTEQSQSLIKEIKNLFEIDMLVANSDRNMTNIIIEDGAFPKLTPIFDNEYSFNEGIIVGGMKLDGNITAIPLIVDEYVSNYSNSMEEKINFLTPEKLREIIAKVEFERNIVIPDDIKARIYKNFVNNWERLSRVILNNKKSQNL